MRYHRFNELQYENGYAVVGTSRSMMGLISGPYVNDYEMILIDLDLKEIVMTKFFTGEENCYHSILSWLKSDEYGY